MKADGKVFVVTGGANGIGRELVMALLRRNARVAAVDIDESGLKKLTEDAADQKDHLSVHVLDITSRDAVYAYPDLVISEHGAVDGVVNNAGIIQPFVRLAELKDEDIRRVMDVNFYATLNMTRAFLPHLLSRSEAHVVNISSMGGFLPVPGQSVYGASKAAVKLLTESLYAELADTSVRVTIVFPGAVGTDIAAHSGVKISAGADQQTYKSLPADKAAEIILEGIQKNRFRILVGQDARFMDLVYRTNPKRAVRYITRKMKNLLPA